MSGQQGESEDSPASPTSGDALRCVTNANEICDLLLGLVEYEELIRGNIGVIRAKVGCEVKGWMDRGVEGFMGGGVVREAQMIDVWQLVWVRRTILGRLVAGVQGLMGKCGELFEVLDKVWGVQACYPTSKTAAAVVEYVHDAFLAATPTPLLWNGVEYPPSDHPTLIFNLSTYYDTLHHLISLPSLPFDPQAYQGGLSQCALRQLPILAAAWAADKPEFDGVLTHCPRVALPLSAILQCRGVLPPDPGHPLLPIIIAVLTRKGVVTPIPPPNQWSECNIELPHGYLEGLGKSGNAHLRYISTLTRPFSHGLILGVVERAREYGELSEEVVELASQVAEFLLTSPGHDAVAPSLQIAAYVEPRCIVTFVKAFHVEFFDVLVKAFFTDPPEAVPTDVADTLCEAVFAVIESGGLQGAPLITRDVLSSSIWQSCSKERKQWVAARMGGLHTPWTGYEGGLPLFSEAGAAWLEGLGTGFGVFLNVCGWVEAAGRWEDGVRNVLKQHTQREVADMVYTHAQREGKVAGAVVHTVGRYVFSDPDIVELIDITLACRFLASPCDNSAVHSLITLLDPISSWIETERIYTYLTSGHLFFGGVLLLHRFDPHNPASVEFSLSCIQLLANLSPGFGLVLWQYFLQSDWSTHISPDQAKALQKEISILWIQCAQTATNHHVEAMCHACSMFDPVLIEETSQNSMHHVIEAVREEIFANLGISDLYAPVTDRTNAIPKDVPLTVQLAELRETDFFNDNPLPPDAEGVKGLKQSVSTWGSLRSEAETAGVDGIARMVGCGVEGVWAAGKALAECEGKAVNLYCNARDMMGGFEDPLVGQKIAKLVVARTDFTEIVKAMEHLADVTEAVVAAVQASANPLPYCKHILDYLSTDTALHQSTWPWLAWTQLLGLCYDTYRSALRSNPDLDIHHLLVNVVRIATAVAPCELRSADVAEILETSSHYPVSRTTKVPFHTAFVDKYKINRSLVSGARRILQTSIGRAFGSLIKKLKMSLSTKLHLVDFIFSQPTGDRSEHLLPLLEAAIGDPSVFRREISETGGSKEIENSLLKNLDSVFSCTGLERVGGVFAGCLTHTADGILGVTKIVLSRLPSTRAFVGCIGPGDRLGDIIEDWLGVVHSELEAYDFSGRGVEARAAWVEVVGEMEKVLMGNPQAEGVWGTAFAILTTLISRLSAAGDRGRANSPLVQTAQSITVLSLTAESAFINRCIPAALLLPHDLRDSFIASLPWFHATFHHDPASLGNLTAHNTPKDIPDILNCLSRVDWSFLAGVGEEVRSGIADVLVPLVVHCVLLDDEKVKSLVKSLPQQKGAGGEYWHGLWGYAHHEVFTKISLSQMVRNGECGEGCIEKKVLAASSIICKRLLDDRGSEGVDAGAARFVSDLRLLLFCVVQNVEHGQAWMMPLDDHISVVQESILPLAVRYGGEGMARPFIATVLSCLSVRSVDILKKTVVQTRTRLPFTTTTMSALMSAAQDTLPRAISLITHAVLSFAASSPPKVNLAILSTAAMLLAPIDASPLLAQVLQASTTGLIHHPHTDPDTILTQAFDSLVMPPSATALSDLLAISQEHQYTSLLLLLLQYKLHDLKSSSKAMPPSELLALLEEVIRVTPGPDASIVDVTALLLVGCGLMACGGWDTGDKRLVDAAQRYLRLLDGLAVKNCGAKFSGIKTRLFKNQGPVPAMQSWHKCDLRMSIACTVLGAHTHHVLGTLSKKEFTSRLSTCKHHTYSKAADPSELLGAASSTMPVLKSALQAQIFPNEPLFVAFV